MTVHKRIKSEIVDYLGQLGLSTDEINVFLYLLQHQSQTVVHISRGLSSGRTKLYHVLESLITKKLVRVEGASYNALSVESLSYLVDQIELQASMLRKNLPSVLDELKKIELSGPHTTKITQLTSIDDIKTSVMHAAQAGIQVDSYHSALLYKQFGRYFDTSFKSQLKKSHTTIRSLLNEKPLLSDSGPITQHQIDAEIIDINSLIYVYGNTVLLISSLTSASVIHNQLLADSYRQQFNAFWEMSA